MDDKIAIPKSLARLKLELMLATAKQTEVVISF